MKKIGKLVLGVACVMPLLAYAESVAVGQYGPVAGEREFSLSGTGSNDRNFDSGSFGVTGDLGWYIDNHLIGGIRQSVNYASIETEANDDDFWNGSTRGYLDYQFGQERLRPFVGGSLGAVYGDGVKDSAFAGLELGTKYYVLPKTYVLGRVEYQWFFDSGSDADEAFKDGAFAYTLGIGYNF